MNDIEKLHGATRFVGLQVSDEMPLHALAPKLFNLRFGLLHAILAERADARFNRLSQDIRRMRLADRNQQDIFRRAIRGARRAVYAAANFRQSFR
jgi:hypothetical protein